MKSDFLTRLLLAVSLITISVSAQADQWYHVELIVFEQLSTVTDEQWPYMTEMSPPTITPDSKNSFMIPAGISTLVGSKKRLDRSPVYRVHYHRAWQQPIKRKGSESAVAIQSDDGMINGSIRLYKSTYLHALVDLWLIENKALINSWSDVAPEGEMIEGVRNPHLEESRRIRTQKLYFFDHPKLGALLEITPIETPVEAQKNLEALQTYSLPNEAAPIGAE
jgi:hypothetical protein